jgi:sulfate adenylyltransferase subunit 2
LNTDVVVTDPLDQLESCSVHILREAAARIRPLCMLWSIGKDSTAMLWLARKAFFGRVPFDLVLLDTGMEMDEVYDFRDHLIRAWGLRSVINWPCPPEEDMDPALPPATRAAMRKTEGLKQLLREKGYKGVFCGIRRDEQSMRAKERVFSPRAHDGSWDFRNQPAEFWDHYRTECPDGFHMRIHPILHWSESEIWRYTRREGIPCCPLYFSRNGRRYRSLGEKNITVPVESSASNIEEIITELETTRTAERTGRAMDLESEDSFETLRLRGYM